MTNLDKQFTAVLEKSPEKRGWTYVVMPGSAEFFGTRGLVKVTGTAMAIRFGVRSWRSETEGTSSRHRRKNLARMHSARRPVQPELSVPRFGAPL